MRIMMRAPTTIVQRPICPVCKHRMGLARVSPGRRGFRGRARSSAAPAVASRKSPFRSTPENRRPGLARRRTQAAAIILLEQGVPALSSSNTLMGLALVPLLKIVFANTAFLIVIQRPFPRLVRLLCRLPIGLLARIVGWFLFAHSTPRHRIIGTSSSRSTSSPPSVGAFNRDFLHLHQPTRCADFARGEVADLYAPQRAEGRRY